MYVYVSYYNSKGNLYLTKSLWDNYDYRFIVNDDVKNYDITEMSLRKFTCNACFLRPEGDNSYNLDGYTLNGKRIAPTKNMIEIIKQ